MRMSFLLLVAQVAFNQLGRLQYRIYHTHNHRFNISNSNILKPGFIIQRTHTHINVLFHIFVFFRDRF
jgi:hypothetical protein